MAVAHEPQYVGIAMGAVPKERSEHGEQQPRNHPSRPGFRQHDRAPPRILSLPTSILGRFRPSPVGSIVHGARPGLKGTAATSRRVRCDDFHVTHAVVLISAERTALPTLGSDLAEVDGVAEAYSVTGEWDFVAILRLSDGDELADAVTGRLARLPGIRRTYTMVAFETFSRHDLDSMFSIGA